MLMKNLIYQTLHVCFNCYFRPLIKWFLRQTTGLCELQRICYGKQVGALRSLLVERSLQLSRCRKIRELCEWLDSASNQQEFLSDLQTKLDRSLHVIYVVKQINPVANPTFAKSLSDCITCIWGYRDVANRLDMIRLNAYDSQNEQHEEQLMLLWDLLMPNILLESRISRQWQDIGFQGDDPKTDFRGMGVLSLQNLLYFCREHKEIARNILLRSQHPKMGYPFAIVGINLTHLAWSLFKDGSAKNYYYNSLQLDHIKTEVGAHLNIFHNFFCYLFVEFDRIWTESEPTDMMCFPQVRTQFETNVKLNLKDPLKILNIGTPVAHV